MDFQKSESKSQVCSLYQKIFPGKVFEFDASQNFNILSDANGDIGFVHFIQIEEMIEIYDLGIVPSLQNKGYGKVLMAKFFESIQASRVILEVSVKNNAALKLYKKFNFVKVGVSAGYYQDGSDALLMERVL